MVTTESASSRVIVVSSAVSQVAETRLVSTSPVESPASSLVAATSTVFAESAEVGAAAAVVVADSDEEVVPHAARTRAATLAASDVL